MLAVVEQQRTAARRARILPPLLRPPGIGQAVSLRPTLLFRRHRLADRALIEQGLRRDHGG